MVMVWLLWLLWERLHKVARRQPVPKMSKVVHVTATATKPPAGMIGSRALARSST